MAAPSIRGQTAPVAGGTTTSPAGTQVGDLVVVYTFERLGAASASTLSLNSGASFSQWLNHFHNDSSTDGALGVAYKVATQAGAQSYQGFTSSTGTPAWWTGCTVLTAGTFDAAASVASAGSSQTTNAVPNPPQVTGLSAARQYLVLAIAAWHLGSSLTNTATAPTNYTNLVQVAGAATADLACSSRAISGATSEDPGTYGDDQAPNGTCSVTIAVANALPPQGSGSSALSIGSTGAGATVMNGAAAVALTLALSGAGAAVQSGNGSAALTLGAQGAGASTHAGAGTNPLTLGTSGAGVSTRTGQGSAALTLAASGVGEAPIASAPEGFGVVTLVLNSDATGYTLHTGTGAAGLSLQSPGIGQAAHTGTSAAALNLVVAGAGVARHAGAGAITLALAAAGTGATVQAGSGAAGLTLVASGVGQAPATAAEGSGVVSLTLGGTGAGRATHAGTGATALTLAASGTGQSTAPTLYGVTCMALDAESRSTVLDAADHSHNTPHESRRTVTHADP